ncbi:MAG: penicillin-binding protein 1C [Weeksellaceae bacterium]|nr:penicillin-binding protein 1C [Weeksellaceae bacterium]
MKIAQKIRVFIARHKIIFGVAGVIFLIWFLFFSLPKPLFSSPSSLVVFGSDGQLLNATTAKDGQWRFPKADSVPLKFEQCILQFEDEYFYHHPGINPMSLFRAAKQNISQGKVVSGGSTISMQTMRIASGNKDRTFAQKALEMLQALRLELGYSKKSILNLYASNAPFGGNVVGLEAASWRYYGKLPHQLSWSESATLAVLPNAPGLIYPGRNSEKLQQKRDRLLQKLLNKKIINEEDFLLAKAEPLPSKPYALPRYAPHFMHSSHKILKQSRIHSTLDSDFQQTLTQVANQHQQNLTAQRINSLAILVIDVKSGEVRGYVGNANTDSNQQGHWVDIIQSPRSSGSILKPFLYEKLLQEGKILPTMLLDDSPSDVTRNYDRQYDGAVPADKALARSLNIPSIDLLRRAGVDHFLQHLRQLGFKHFTQDAKHYGLSLVVGGGDVSLFELGTAYRNLAYRIVQPEERKHNPQLQLSTDQTLGRKSISEFQLQSTYLTIEALEQVARPDVEHGWRMFSRNPIAWKTGTSHGFKDAWAVGMSTEYVVAVWAGNADGEGHPAIIGVKAAAPVMFDVFSRLGASGRFPEPTQGWKSVEICVESGYKPNPNCPNTKKIKTPALGANMAACPYHKIVHLDETGQFQVNSSCYDVGRMRNEVRFILPPVQEWYYQNKNPQYKKTPAFHPDCHENSRQDFAFIYPRNLTRIYLPRDMQGNTQDVVFHVVHSKPNGHIYWYLDGSFIGETSHIHKLPLQPATGEHVLTLMDDSGKELRKRFTILSMQ